MDALQISHSSNLGKLNFRQRSSASGDLDAFHIANLGRAVSTVIQEEIVRVIVVSLVFHADGCLALASGFLENIAVRIGVVGVRPQAWEAIVRRQVAECLGHFLLV